MCGRTYHGLLVRRQQASHALLGGEGVPRAVPRLGHLRDVDACVLLRFSINLLFWGGGGLTLMPVVAFFLIDDMADDVMSSISSSTQ